MKRITLFCGHYGSGKTNIAVNYAKFLKKQGLATVIADLDIVNPYFRTKDSEDELAAAGIEVISLPFANTSVDLPSLPSQAYSIVQDTAKYAVLDIGGDDRGAYALGRYAPAILKEDNFDNFFVANFYRPLTRCAEEALEVMREIEAAGHIPFTGIINNSNLGEATRAEDIKNTFAEAEKLSELSGLPLVYTTARADIAKDLEIESVFSLDLQKKYW